MAKTSQIKGMPAVTPHSGPARILKHNGTRKSMQSPDKAMVIPHSGTRMDVAGNSNIGNPYAVASDRTEQSIGKVPTVTPHSPIAVPRNPKKFNKQSFAAGVMTKMPKGR